MESRKQRIQHWIEVEGIPRNPKGNSEGKTQVHICAADMESNQPRLDVEDRELWERCPQERKSTTTKSNDRFPDKSDLVKKCTTMLLEDTRRFSHRYKES